MALEVLWRGGPFTPLTDEPPVYPHGMLTHHVLFKGAQAGSVVGLAFGIPYVYTSLGRHVHRLLRCAVRGCGCRLSAQCAMW